MKNIYISSTRKQGNERCVILRRRLDQNCFYRRKKRKEHLLQLSERMPSLKDICSGLPLDPLPRRQQRDNAVPHAPVRTPNLTQDEELV